MSFKAYIENVEVKSGKSRDKLYRTASEKEFIVDGKIVATHKQLLEWLKSDIDLGHVHTNFVIAIYGYEPVTPKLPKK